MQALTVLTQALLIAVVLIGVPVALRLLFELTDRVQEVPEPDQVYDYTKQHPDL